MNKIAGLRLMNIVAQPYIHLSFENVERLDLIMVNVEGWPTISWHNRL